MNPVLTWAHAQPLAAVAASVLLLAAAAFALRPLRRSPAAVTVAALAAAACTAYSADTSWRFAEHRLNMTSTGERAAMFAAAELALFACALMARQNLRTQGAPGTPGLLVWFITTVQVIPAYSESGIVGGTVRAVVGPVLAALLWHLAMGIELRHAKPGTESGSLPALLAREARERLLSRLGLAVRDRSAEQITRDRATVKAVALAAKLATMAPKARGRARVERRLSVAVGKAQAGADDEQRVKLLDLLAARRHAAALATIDLPSPWETSEEITVEQVTEERPELPPAPRPPVVPTGIRLLPIVTRPDPVEVTAAEPARQFRLDHFAERYVPVEKPDKVVIPKLDDVDVWAHKFPYQMTIGRPPSTTNVLPVEQPRQVVTEPIVRTPADLRREARRLHREAVRSTNRPVTVHTLQTELGLSRRDATDLRREILGEARS